MGQRRLLKTKVPKERIALLSDGTCETAEIYVRAILAQFKKAEVELSRFPKIRLESEILSVLDQLEPPYLIAYTFATENLRKLLWQEVKKRSLVGIDILYPAVEVFATFLNIHPSEEHGALHSTQALNYYDRVEAVEYTVKHDDGMKVQDLTEADLVLTGVSRTSKTPTSMYLAHKGYRVANVPLVHGIEPPRELLKLGEQGVPVFFLTIDAVHLAKIRQARFQRLGTHASGNDTYIDIRKIQEELNAALLLARRQKWSVIDVTNKAIEETASEILLLADRKDS